MPKRKPLTYKQFCVLFIGIPLGDMLTQGWAEEFGLSAVTFPMGLNEAGKKDYLLKSMHFSYKQRLRQGGDLLMTSTRGKELRVREDKEELQRNIDLGMYPHLERIN